MNSRSERYKKIWRLERQKISISKIKKIAIITSIIVVIVTIWGKLIEPNILTINDYKIENSSIPESFNGTRIVQFSDVHYGKLDERRSY